MNPIAMHPFDEKKLCVTLDPSVKYDSYFFTRIPGDDRTFSMRPFCIPHDLPTMHKWIRKMRGDDDSKINDNGYGDTMLLKELLETYRYLLTSGHSQSLMAEVNDDPILQLDIIRADKDAMNPTDKPMAGDYCLHFLFSPLFEDPTAYYIEALRKSLDGIFYFPEVKRLFCKSYTTNKESNRFLQNAGFVLDKKVWDYTRFANIYRYEQVAAISR